MSPSNERESTRRAWISAATILLTVAAAVFVVHYELKAHSYRDILRELREIPTSHRLLAAAFTIGGYAVLTIYDVLALHYAKVKLGFAKIAFTSFTAFAFSNTLGWPVLTGGALRYRLFTGWGISAAETARAIAFSMATFWIGAVAILGAGMVFAPSALSVMLHTTPSIVRAAGIILLALLLLYVMGSKVIGPELRIRRVKVMLPVPRLALAQLAVSAIDWMLASAVLYALLPDDLRISILAVAFAFVIAQVAGLISHVPGGLGVFEAVLLVLLGSHEDPTTLFAAVVAYRIIYYLVPFFIATALLLAYEAAQRGQGIIQIARVAGLWLPAAIPQALAIATFVAGTVMLVSGVTPAAHGRLAELNHLLPLSVIEISHFTASLVGVGLLLLAWALQRRLSFAFHAVVVLILLGIPASVLKGFDYEEAALLTVLLLILLPAHKYFYRRASVTAEVLTPGWIAAIAAVLGGVTWLGFFAYRHVEYRSELWWRFAWNADAPRFLRATVGAVAATAAFAAWRLVRPARPDPDPPSVRDLELASDIAHSTPDSAAYLALLGDKRLLFDDTGTGFLMYGVAGRSWVALHDPFGDRETQRELAWRFRELVDRHGGWTVFYEVSRSRLDLYLDLGLRLLKLGEEARVPLEQFSLDTPERKKLRRTVRQVEREGFSFELLPPEQAQGQMQELRSVSDAWLANKNTREKGFSLGSFSESYVRNFPIAVVRDSSRIVAFANVWEGGGKSELSIDLMRYTTDAPASVMEYLFISLMLWGKEQDYHDFNLGMAPLAGFHSRTLAPLWTRAGAFVYRYGEHFYNFRGLRDYKNKFDPIWEPRYIATPASILLPAVLANVASLISGGYRGIISK